MRERTCVNRLSRERKDKVEVEAEKKTERWRKNSFGFESETEYVSYIAYMYSVNIFKSKR